MNDRTDDLGPPPRDFRPFAAPHAALPAPNRDITKGFITDPPTGVQPPLLGSTEPIDQTDPYHSISQQSRIDRHAVGEHPYDAALAALYAERDGLTAAIEVLERLKGKEP
jgi:hypothetical protein